MNKIHILPDMYKIMIQNFKIKVATYTYTWESEHNLHWTSIPIHSSYLKPVTLYTPPSEHN